MTLLLGFGDDRALAPARLHPLSVHWLRHAIAAAGRLARAEEADPDDLAFVDRASAGLLTDALAHFAELSDWETVTLLDIAEHATPMDDDRFAGDCTCRPA